jgi:threonine/homoserine/homoserine lactone efflux protein
VGVATLAAFALLELTLCVIPGPAVLFVLSTALRRGTRTGLMGAAGIVAGNTAYFVLSACGVAALLLASYTLFGIVKWCGIAYLAYLGLRALFARRSDLESTDESSRAFRGRTFTGALLTQLSNPKAIVFFVAVLPQFIDPHANVWLQLAVLALVSAAIEFGVLASYTLAADRVRRTGAAGRAALWIERAGGIVLLGIAAFLAREPLAVRAP